MNPEVKRYNSFHVSPEMIVDDKPINSDVVAQCGDVLLAAYDPINSSWATSDSGPDCIRRAIENANAYVLANTGRPPLTRWQLQKLWLSQLLYEVLARYRDGDLTLGEMTRGYERLWKAYVRTP